MKTILIIVGLLAVLGLGWFFMNMNSSDNLSPNMPQQMPTPTVTNAATPPAAIAPVIFTVEITSAGFSPSTINIKRGTTVVFKNKDTVAHWPASSKHPTHLDYPGFDAMKGIAPGGEFQFTFDEVKSIGVHDHLNPKLFAKIVISE